jgi:ubiquinone/menaquinone biosynthesis C-methylase UbiE
MRRYILGNTAQGEYERLDLMSKILDPRTQASLLALGLREGWHCLEVGGGNGSVTEWLCEKVGASGSVTSIDINTKLIELVQAGNLVVRELDVRTNDLPVATFDLVTCRATLHQISDQAQSVLEKMAAAVKPGGWLFVCEPDFNVVRTCEPESWRSTWSGVTAWGQTQGVDWFIGRKLPAMVDALGFGSARAKTEVPNIRGTTRDAVYFQLFLQMVRDRVVDSGHLNAETIDAAIALLDDPHVWTQCWMLTSVWVRKPQRI